MKTRLGRPAVVYIGAVVVAGFGLLGLCLVNALQAPRDRMLLLWAAMALLTLFGGRLSLRLPLPNCIVSFSDALIVLSLLLFGPDLATVTAALDGYAASARQGGGWLKRFFNTAGLAIAFNLPARLFVMMTAGRGVGGAFRSFTGDLLLPLLLMAASQWLLNTALVAGAVALREHVSFVRVWERSVVWAGTSITVGAIAAALVYLVAQQAGPLTLLTILPFPVIVSLACRASLRRPAAQRVS
ncbi:MAG TPA: hypothetical protein VFT43_01230 [Candidatus Polarisedimenticolia bacterium]|nr:hypothetical protein [Candidatus Polarisedimenticolia bacterium]